MNNSSPYQLEIYNLATAILTNKIDYITGCRGITKTLASYDIYSNSHIMHKFQIFVLVDSETDHLPIGNARKLWNEKALREKDKEIQRIYELYKEDIIEKCKEIVKNYKK